jgi:hypothetical protein
MAHRAADASVLRDVVEQFQMMNIHHAWQRTAGRPRRNAHPEPTRMAAADAIGSRDRRHQFYQLTD